MRTKSLYEISLDKKDAQLRWENRISCILAILLVILLFIGGI